MNTQYVTWKFCQFFTIYPFNFYSKPFFSHQSIKHYNHLLYLSLNIISSRLRHTIIHYSNCSCIMFFTSRLYIGFDRMVSFLITGAVPHGFDSPLDPSQLFHLLQSLVIFADTPPNLIIQPKALLNTY